MSGPWFVVTTGAVASDSKAGLAVLVHKRLGGPEQISVQTHLKGRLMHVRIHQGGTVLTLSIFINMFGVRNLTRKATPNAEKVFGENLDRLPQKSPREILWLLGAILTAPLEG